MPVRLGATLVTNLAGLNTTIDFNGSYLRMRIPESTQGRRLALVDAFNERGESVKGWSGSWGQHGFMKEMNSSTVKSNLTVSVAIVRNIEFEFIVDPVLVQEISPPPADPD